VKTSPRKPNVLIFIPHDLGDRLGCYGYRSVKSPNIDKLASRGVRFTNYFTAAPECTPSRAGMFTGLYTHQNGLMGLTHRGWEFNPGVEHLAKRFWRGGYQTCLFGWQHEIWGMASELGYNHQFDQRSMNEAYETAPICESVARFVQSPEASGERPWFACVGFQDVHRPWKAETSFSPDEVEVPPYLPDDPAVRKDFAQFHGCIAGMDAAVGKALDALERSPAAENTIVIFTTDHGIPFPGAKSTYYDPGIKIPLIVRWPGHTKEAQVRDQLLSNLDFFPTLLDACGLPIPDGLEGRSFRPLLEGGPCDERQEVFGALYYDSLYDPMHMVRTRRYKYIRSFAVTPQDARNCDPATLAKHVGGRWIRADDGDVQNSLTWEFMKAAGPYSMPPPEELYDLQTDPLEQHNLAADPAHASVLADLRARLQEMMKRTKSPLLSGQVLPTLSRTRNLSWPDFQKEQARTKPN
jgi:N-sulfoglucosamine sulfohydrolase